MEEYIYDMVNQYCFTTKQAIDMHEVLQKVSKNSNISIEEAVKLVRGGK